MVTWNKYSFIYTNGDEVYRDFLNRTGAESITHYGLTTYGDPAQESFLREIDIIQHTLKVGDNMSKLAHKHYGEARYWWIIAWFNSKPTDLHCKIGENILIPTPLEAAVSQAYSVSEL